MTAPRTSLTDLINAARPNRLIQSMARAAAKADHLAAADRDARLALVLLAEGNTETAELLFKSAIEHRAAA